MSLYKLTGLPIAIFTLIHFESPPLPCLFDTFSWTPIFISPGWTGEKVCLAGDSAGGNLCLTTSMRAGAFGVRMPDGVVAAYPATLLTAYASPSRLLTLMDPLLPLSVLTRCLGAYAGRSESAYLKIFGGSLRPIRVTHRGVKLSNKWIGTKIKTQATMVVKQGYSCLSLVLRELSPEVMNMNRL